MSSTSSEFDVTLHDAMRAFPAGISAKQLQLVKADLQLSVDYAGQHVAYLDVWEDRGGASVLHREVLAAAASREEIVQFARAHPQADYIECDYIDSVQDGLEPALGG